MPVRKIISGGQTGADRGGLDAAIALGIDHGGFCPRGRRAEDGPIPDRYHLEEIDSPRYEVRTEKNVLASDGTVLFTHGKLTGGSGLTKTLADRHGKPLLHVDLNAHTVAEAAAQLREWLADQEIATLNVAGTRETGCPGLAAEVAELIRAALTA